MSRVAHALDRDRHGRHVAVAMGRRRELVAVLLGVLRSGRTYVPLDPAAPAERVRHILAQFDAVSLVADDGALPDAAVPLRRSPEALLAAPGPAAGGAPASVPSTEDTAYVIFTSGSTGVPKGVEVTHRNVMRLFTATEEHYDFDENDVWCLFHSYAFDFSVWELFGALLYGGRLVIPDDRAVREPDRFAAMLADTGITVLNQTPSAFRRLTAVLTEEIAAALSVRWVVFGGEALLPDSLRGWVALMGDRARLANMYGITETTVHTTFQEIDPPRWPPERRAKASSAGRSPTCGSPSSTATSAAARSGCPARSSSLGTAWRAAIWAGPDLTAERFLTGTPYGERVYRTGDARDVRPDGTLVYLNRLDHQVQIRGYRVELGEVESALRAVSGLKDAYADIHTPDGGEPLLAAWIVADAGGGPADADVRAALVDRLPHYMVPSLFLRVPELPLTVNGKIDVSALPRPPAPPQAGAAAGRAQAGRAQAGRAQAGRAQAGRARATRRWTRSPASGPR